jgi:hypothetical protein
MLAVHTGVIPVFVTSYTSRRSVILQKHETVPGGLEQTHLLSGCVHDGIVVDFIVAGYAFSSTASKPRVPIFDAER